MDSSLSPREIQARIRAGATLEEVAAEAGVDEARLAAFAGPVIAEREHMARQALSCTVRRRGEAGSHRRLGQLVAERLQVRGIDADEIVWDASRQQDLRWRVLGTLSSATESRSAEFLFDPRGRFSIAGNPDARWMIGEEVAGSSAPDDENTVDLRDDLAIVRAVTATLDTAEQDTAPADLPGDDIPAPGVMYEPNEDTSQLDELYDMLSGISEDSVRIYTGIDQDLAPQAEPRDSVAPEEPTQDTDAIAPDGTAPDGTAPDETTPENPEGLPQDQPVAKEVPGPESAPATETNVSPDEPSIHGPLGGEATGKPKQKRGRAHVPSWDEIMFGAPRAPKSR